MFPVPYLLQELLTSQIITSQTVLTQFLFHLNLGGDTCMVHTGQPQRIIALHTLKTNQGILQRSVHCVTHMELTGNVGGRHNNRERLGISGLVGLKMTVLLPHLIDFIFYLLRFINLGQFSLHTKHSLTKNVPSQRLRTK